MEICYKIIDIKKKLRKLEGKRIGFAPTMGALHAGHLSLIERSKKENDYTVVSIFVNPAQFNNSEDFKNYPDRLKTDIEILKEQKIEFLFVPSAEEIYVDNYKYKVIETDLSKKLCGRFRKGHFEGVLTVVMKLFNIINPANAYFGEKDYQQLMLVKGMVKAFFMEVNIVSCPTVREEDGLALSSRNLRLTENERRKAILFPKLLQSNLSDVEVKNRLSKNGFSVDYIESKFGRRFGAAYLGKVRLIDNVKK